MAQHQIFFDFMALAQFRLNGGAALDMLNIMITNRQPVLFIHSLGGNGPISSKSATAKSALLIPVASAFILLLGLLCSSMVSAQSSGLKLGQESPAQPKLDLGAAPKPQAPAQAPAANAAPAAGVVTNGAWQVSCNEGADCAMAQIGKDKSGTPILEMVVRKLPAPLEADGRTAIAVVDFITPLGVVLTSGLELKIDAGKGEAAPFQICTEQGCLVREPVDQTLIDRLKKGNNAQVSVVAANQGNVTATISLSGFTKSYNSLR